VITWCRIHHPPSVASSIKATSFEETKKRARERDELLPLGVRRCDNRVFLDGHCSQRSFACSSSRTKKIACSSTIFSLYIPPGVTRHRHVLALISIMAHLDWHRHCGGASHPLAVILHCSILRSGSQTAREASSRRPRNSRSNR
jgi:hypothetical protein